MDLQEARTTFAADRSVHESKGAIFPDVQSYIPDGYGQDFRLAMDAIAQPGLSSTANAGIMSMLTTYIDPKIYQVLFAPNKAAIIFEEVKTGDWLTETAAFPYVENTGEVSSYGDYNENGSTNANSNFPQRQSYLFQTILQYGDREVERAGLAKINWVAQLQSSAALALNKFSNYTYFFGVQNLQNYGALNDPNLTAALTPATKAYGGTAWIVGGQIKATANEIFADIQALVIQLIAQTDGLVEEEDKMCLALSPASKVALTATNSFGVNVYALLKENFKNLRIESATQYSQQSATNPQGVVGGNLMQLIADETEGQKTAYVSFSEKMRAHRLIPATSSFKQKMTSGTWGAVVRQPANISQMLGI